MSIGETTAAITTLRSVDDPAAADVRRRVREIVIEMAPEQDVAVGDETDLVDGLGYHSLALVELAFALEDEFALEPIGYEDTEGIRTTGEVETLIVRAMAGEISAASSVPATAAPAPEPATVGVTVS